jgi:membrane protease YdiL (CAAX protease family)
MDDGSPRARALPFALMMAALAAQVALRYKLDVLNTAPWQGVHILFGMCVCLTILVAFHGLEPLRRVRAKSWCVLVGGVVCFLLFWHLGRLDSFNRWFRASVDPSDPLAPIYGFVYFSSSSVVFRLLIPFALAWAVLRLRPGDLGLRASSNPHAPAVRTIGPLYFALFLGVLPFVLYAAGTAPFLAKYPLGRAMVQQGHILMNHLLVHECFYLLVFVSGEAFWRGFLSFGLERDFGVYALALMIVPYVTGHFGKPYIETLGAIVAGGLLGWLALKHRSIWWGVALHYGVAITMDLLAIRGNGFTIGWP